MVYVTHDQVDAMTLADRIAIMDKGEIQQVAPPTTLYDEPVNEFVATFVGTPPMNFLEGGLELSSAGLIFTGGAGLRVPLPLEFSAGLSPDASKPVRLGIRPEHVRCGIVGTRLEGGATLVARVEMTDNLGHEKVVHLSQGNHRFLGKVDAHLPIAPGERVDVVFDARKVHLCDPASGLNLTCRSPASPPGVPCPAGNRVQPGS